MAVSTSYLAMVTEQLRRAVPALRTRRMFGGVGVYSEQAFFALLDDDVLYFKVDATSRPRYEARGLAQFRPFGETGAGMQYFQVPEEVLEDVDELRAWAEEAVAVSRRAKRK